MHLRLPSQLGTILISESIPAAQVRISIHPTHSHYCQNISLSTAVFICDPILNPASAKSFLHVCHHRRRHNCNQFLNTTQPLIPVFVVAAAAGISENCIEFCLHPGFSPDAGKVEVSVITSLQCGHLWGHSYWKHIDSKIKRFGGCTLSDGNDNYVCELTYFVEWTLF